MERKENTDKQPTTTVNNNPNGKSQLNWQKPRIPGVVKRLPLFLFLMLAATSYGQTGTTGVFEYSATNGQITITSCGAGGALSIPATISVSGTNLPVTAIAAQAFSNDQNLTSITIPDSVTSIGDAAFHYCTNLTNVTIGAGVSSMGGHSFVYCFSLTAFTVSQQNATYSNSTDGVLFNKSKTALIAYPSGKTGVYTIPSGVTSIGDWAFEGGGQIANVIIPNGVTTIGISAFEGCSITLLLIPNSVTTIGDCAFLGCPLTDVTLGTSLASIGQGAFSSCIYLTTVTLPNSITSIGQDAFDGCPLKNAVFNGHAPLVTGTGAYSAFDRNIGFTIEYYNGAIGFTSPTWTDSSGNSYPSVDLGTQPQPNSSLQVTILPVDAVSAGAEWQVDGGPFQTSGTTVTGLSSGVHILAFSGVNGWVAPAPQLIAVSSSNSTIISGTYTEAPLATSWLTVGINPGWYSLGGSGQWQVDGGAFQSSAVSVQLSVGTHTVAFSTVSGWITPPSQTIMIYANITNWTYGTYTQIPWTDATNLGSGWYDSSWFGTFNTNNYPWIYHVQHGFMYVFGTDPTSIWLYNSTGNMGFLWTGSTVYPWLWSDTEQTWMYYVPGTSNPRWFFNWNTQQWEQHNP